MVQEETPMNYYSVELIDINENIENFKFNKISHDDLEKIKECFKSGADSFFEFTCIEGDILLQSKFFRGLMSAAYQEPPKTLLAETLENSVEITKIDLPRR